MKAEYDNAILVSPPYKFYSTTPKCVELWYHAYGYDVGTLNVYKFEKGGITGKHELLFTITGNQGNEWSESGN